MPDLTLVEALQANRSLNRRESEAIALVLMLELKVNGLSAKVEEHLRRMGMIG